MKKGLIVLCTQEAIIAAAIAFNALKTESGETTPMVFLPAGTPVSKQTLLSKNIIVLGHPESTLAIKAQRAGKTLPQVVAEEYSVAKQPGVEALLLLAKENNLGFVTNMIAQQSESLGFMVTAESCVSFLRSIIRTNEAIFTTGKKAFSDTSLVKVVTVKVANLPVKVAFVHSLHNTQNELIKAYALSPKGGNVGVVVERTTSGLRVPYAPKFQTLIDNILSSEEASVKLGIPNGTITFDRFNAENTVLLTSSLSNWGEESLDVIIDTMSSLIETVGELIQQNENVAVN